MWRDFNWDSIYRGVARIKGTNKRGEIISDKQHKGPLPLIGLREWQAGQVLLEPLSAMADQEGCPT